MGVPVGELLDDWFTVLVGQFAQLEFPERQEKAKDDARFKLRSFARSGRWIPRIREGAKKISLLTSQT